MLNETSRKQLLNAQEAASSSELRAHSEDSLYHESVAFAKDEEPTPGALGIDQRSHESDLTEVLSFLLAETSHT